MPSRAPNDSIERRGRDVGDTRLAMSPTSFAYTGEQGPPGTVCEERGVMSAPHTNSDPRDLMLPSKFGNHTRLPTETSTASVENEKIAYVGPCRGVREPRAW